MRFTYSSIYVFSSLLISSLSAGYKDRSLYPSRIPFKMARDLARNVRDSNRREYPIGVEEKARGQINIFLGHSTEDPYRIDSLKYAFMDTSTAHETTEFNELSRHAALRIIVKIFEVRLIALRKAKFTHQERIHYLLAYEGMPPTYYEWIMKIDYIIEHTIPRTAPGNSEYTWRELAGFTNKFCNMFGREFMNEYRKDRQIIKDIRSDIATNAYPLTQEMRYMHFRTDYVRGWEAAHVVEGNRIMNTIGSSQASTSRASSSWFSDFFTSNYRNRNRNHNTFIDFNIFTPAPEHHDHHHHHHHHHHQDNYYDPDHKTPHQLILDEMVDIMLRDTHCFSIGAVIVAFVAFLACEARRAMI
ncbi:hypothetical protein MJO29_011384 [Puccinia striiformis f. sp. tritici]|uniref:hypothetical protein n=1 Tax=Puccinia striiformis f. sp. tritici TaxID=168172 RepID=UPI00200832FC|nr:hypothetical protein Pst134EA_021212 [Puccinia striiformis f. sp. tritici]KAH9457329.1 hypothetical protein Pst134EA_021212 [Puccinia striiformis f. sp. tritici]KAI7946857.1 hypothetical protein MJO29_011384 [Puccinia striiformis f. sp. tritici]